MLYRIALPNLLAAVGLIAIGAVVALSSFGVVYAEHPKPIKKKSVFNCSIGTACLEGDSSGASTWGVYGLSSTADGVHGVTSATNGNSGASGISTATTGSAHGVYGRSSNGQGVYGTSSTTNGVEGHSTGNGGSGVAGIQTGTSSDSGNGLYGESADTTNLYEAIEAKADSANTYIFEGFNAKTDGLCTIDYNAALSCTGGAILKNVRTRHRDTTGRRVLAYAAESASATINDVGSARLIAGSASVPLHPDFARVIDRDAAYYVFLTPLGDTRGLYVSAKSPAGFQVRETQGGRSSISFDYRIVAHPADASGDRLSPAPGMRAPERGLDRG